MAKKLSDIDAILTSESESVKPYKYRAKVFKGNDFVFKIDYNDKPVKKWACGYYQQAVMLAEKLNEQAPKPEVFEEGEKVARKCSVTGEGMNEGWIANEGEQYFKYEEDALAWCKENGYKSIKKAYEEDVIYWTEWDANEDHEYIVRNGKLVEVEEETTVSDKDKAINLLNSLEEDCNMAISGEWDCSSDEGKEGFNSMIDSINTIKDIINKYIK